MTISNFPNGFSHGINVRGLPILNSYSGQVLWVDSNAGSDGNKGTFDRPFASIDYTVGKCDANAGDIIMVKPGHSESVTEAGEIALDVAGISIVGLGRGTSRPTITFDTVITADLDVDASNITVANILFANGIDNLTAPIDVNAANFAMMYCETRDNDSNYHCDDFILTDANADGLYIEGWVHDAFGGKTGPQTAISVVGGTNVTIIPHWIVGDFATACIENVTTAAQNLQVFGSANYPAYLRTQNSADVIFTAVATTTGRVGPFLNARLEDDAANITEAFVGADMEFFQPINIVNADGESSLQTNISASTDA